MVVFFLVGFIIAILFGMGISLALSFMFVEPLVFWFTTVLWFVVLGVMVFIGIKIHSKIGLVFIFLMIFGAIVPFLMGWVP